MSRNFVKYGIIILFLLINCHFSFANETSQVGTTTANFLKMGMGARASGMGGAFVAISNDSSAVYWNSAGLTQIKEREISGVHNQWFEDIKTEYISYVQPLKGNSGVMGVSLIYMNVPDIEKRTITGEKAGSVKVNNLSYDVAYGYKLTPNLSTGVKLKGIFQEYGDDKGNGFAADFGLLFVQPGKGNEKLSFGLNIQNIGPKVKIGSEEEKLPFNVKGGIALTLAEKGVTVALDADKPIDNKMKFHSGVEYWFREKIALRFGYEDVGNLGSGSGFTFGCGFKGYETEEFLNMLVHLDYALLSFGDFGYTHRFALTLNF